MSGTYFYTLPSNPELVAEIVESIPDSWAWVYGCLIAPKEAYTQGRVVSRTRLRFDRDMNSRVVAADDVAFEDERWGRHPQPETKLQIKELSSHQCPSSVLFEHVGCGSQHTAIARARDCAATYIRAGYKGWISAANNYRINPSTDNPVRIKINHGISGGIEITQQPHLHLMWDERYGGTPPLLEPILQRCRELKLSKI